MTLAWPKPEKPARGSKAAREHMGLVAQLACVCCNRYAVVVHHVIMGRFARRRASDFDTIPLCSDHHDPGIPGSLHHSPAAWRTRFGLDTDHLEPTRARVELLRARTIGGRT
jgi:hypothetical protein